MTVSAARFRPAKPRRRSPAAAYRLRSDLTVKEAGDSSIGSDVVMLDPISGEEHRLTPDEYLICQVAGEETTIRGVREKYRLETGRDIPPIQLIPFFQRLQSKGLLDESDAGSLQADVNAVDHFATTAGASEGEPDGTGAGPSQDAPRRPAAPGLTKPVDRPGLQTTSDNTAEPRSSPHSAPPSVLHGHEAAADQPEKPTSVAHAWTARRARRKARTPQNGASQEDAGTASRDQATPGPMPSAGHRHRPGLADRGEPSGNGRRATPGDDFDDWGDIDDMGPFGLGGGARRRGRLGPDVAAGMAANDGSGMGFGATGGMGFGAAGGMGAGFARRFQDGSQGENGPGNGRNRALLAELMRARRRGEEPEPERGAAQISLFDPNALLGLLCVLFWPLKLLYVPLLVLLVPLGFLIAVERRDNVVHDLAGLMDLSIIATSLAGLFIVNLASRLAQGAVIRGFGGEVRQLGVRLAFGFVPRFIVDRSALGQLSRRGQLWAHGSPVVARLVLFCAGLVIWAVYRHTGSLVSELSLLIGVIGASAFLLSACPLIPADGYRWLATYLTQPMLRQKAAAALKAKLAGEPLPPTVASNEVAGLVLFGIGSVLACAALALTLLLYAGTVLVGEFRGPGMLVFLALCAAFLLWLAGLRRSAGKQDLLGLDSAALQQLLAGAPGQAEQTAEQPASIATRGRVLWAVLAFALLGVAFLPYHYEPGGSFEITPTSRSTATAQTDGELVEIFVREGSAVKAGQVIAQLSSWSQQSAVDVTRAELKQAQAELARLESSPTPEELALAESKVESARARTTYNEAQAKRAEELVSTGVVSKSEWEKATSDLETSLADLKVAEADLQLVRRGPTESQIEAARAEVERIQHELSFKLDELERTRIIAPTDGRVVTPNVHLLQGIWLRTGSELLRIENTRTVEAMIDVPEADVGLISVSDTVRLKPWEDSDVEITGAVTEISPIAEERDYGKVIRVRAPIDNELMRLRPGMTGYAKIQGSEMRVWEAYLRFLVRFVRVEVWSWIP